MTYSGVHQLGVISHVSDEPGSHGIHRQSELGHRLGGLVESSEVDLLNLSLGGSVGVGKHLIQGASFIQNVGDDVCVLSGDGLDIRNGRVQCDDQFLQDIVVLGEDFIVSLGTVSCVGNDGWNQANNVEQAVLGDIEDRHVVEIWVDVFKDILDQKVDSSVVTDVLLLEHSQVLHDFLDGDSRKLAVQIRHVLANE